MLTKSQTAIKFERLCVLLNNFQMQDANSDSPSLIFDKRHRGSSPAATAIVFAEIKLVDEGITAQPLETVAKTEHCICDRRVAVENEPCTAEVGILQQRDESGTRLFAIVTVAVEGVVRLHEVEEQFGVRCFGDAELRAVSHGF